MPSQFFGLNIAYTGLLASNAALNTTSNNIANVHTEGYSRQQVTQQASNALRVFQTYGCAGAGVETLSIGSEMSFMTADTGTTPPRLASMAKSIIPCSRLRVILTITEKTPVSKPCLTSLSPQVFRSL